MWSKCSMLKLEICFVLNASACNCNAISRNLPFRLNVTYMVLVYEGWADIKLKVSQRDRFCWISYSPFSAFFLHFFPLLHPSLYKSFHLSAWNGNKAIPSGLTHYNNKNQPVTEQTDTGHFCFCFHCTCPSLPTAILCCSPYFFSLSTFHMQQVMSPLKYIACHPNLDSAQSFNFHFSTSQRST